MTGPIDGPIAFQGAPGANSDIACRAVFPGVATLPCPAFEDVFAAVREGRAERAMIPVENSIHGRVADIHHLLPDGGLMIVGEHFQPIHHCLLALRGTDIAAIREAHSHVQALGQTRETLRRLGIRPAIHADTAGAAEDVARWGDPARAAIASSLAAEIYGLDILMRNIEDAPHNTTRFLIMAREAIPPPPDCPVIVTGFAFEVRNIPAALYKVLGGFATNGVNMTKLESYMVGGSFTATQFYAEVEGDPGEPAMIHAFDELRFFARSVDVLGVFPGDPARRVSHAPRPNGEREGPAGFAAGG
jgi:prephenate dehydratase